VIALDISLRISELLTSLSRLHIVAGSSGNVKPILAEFQGAVSALVAYLQLLDKNAVKLREEAYNLQPDDPELVQKASALVDKLLQAANRFIKIVKNVEPYVGI
jgi:hypothetical protein